MGHMCAGALVHGVCLLFFIYFLLFGWELGDKSSQFCSMKPKQPRYLPCEVSFFFFSLYMTVKSTSILGASEKRRIIEGRNKDEYRKLQPQLN